MIDKNYLKNKYYTVEDIDRAKQLLDDYTSGKYKQKLLRQGNKKLPDNVVIWDLPSVVTCKCQCSGCYAVKAERLYKNTRTHRAFHYELIKYSLLDEDKKNQLLDRLTEELTTHSKLYKVPVCRLHSSGDIFSLDYLDFLLELVTRNPQVYFYTYTKTLDNNMVDYINSTYKNLNIVKSLIDGKYKNYGGIDYLKSLGDKLKSGGADYYICTYGFDNDKTTCMVDCTKCLYCSNILFKQH